MSKQENQCTGSYPVSGYTRGNGIEVDSYIRNCWKHSGGNSLNTNESIDNANEKLDKINDKETITDEDLDLSRGYLSATISNVCEDCENYLNEQENKTQIPTLESIEKDKILEKRKENILSNLQKSMSMIDKIEKIEKKNWDTINTNDKNYGDKLQKYAKHKETNNNISKNLLNLHYAILHSYPIGYNYITDLWRIIIQAGEDFIVKHANKENTEFLGDGASILFNSPEANELFHIGLKDNNYNEDYVIKNGKLHDSIKDIDSSKYDIQAIKNRVSEETGGKIKDCKVLVLRPDSSLAQKIKMSSNFNKFLDKNLDTLKQNGSISDQKIEFFNPDSDLYNSLHGAVIKDATYKNGEISLKVEDFYNFNKGRTSVRGRIGEKLQNQGDLENYYIIINIKFKI